MNAAVVAEAVPRGDRRGENRGRPSDMAPSILADDAIGRSEPFDGPPSARSSDPRGPAAGRVVKAGATSSRNGARPAGWT